LLLHREALEARYDQRKLGGSEATAAEKMVSSLMNVTSLWISLTSWGKNGEHFMMIPEDFLVMLCDVHCPELP
jgi:hypothetical protein